MQILPFQPYWKHNIMLTDTDPKNTVLTEKHAKHFLLYEHLKIYINKDCKTGVRECTLLRSTFFKACMHVSC